MKKLIKHPIPALFLCSITLMGLWTFFGQSKTYSENEKRILSEFPSFTWESVISGEFQDGLETYVSDHISGRDFFVGTNAYFDKLMGKNALKDIYFSKDGYLINAPKANDDTFFKKNMGNISAFTAKSKIPSTLMIVPSAGYIMEDKLPLNHKSYRDDEFFKTASELTENIRFFDTRAIIYDSYKAGSQMYYRTDHHLTSEGSYALYREYCDLTGINYPDRDDYAVETHLGFYGTTYSSSGYFMEDSDTLEIWDLGLDVKVTFEDGKTTDTMFFKDHLKRMDMYPVYLDGNHSYVRIENPKARGGNLLIIRDSYAQNMAPFLAYNYKNIHMLDMRYYRGSMKEFLEDKDIDEVLYLYGIDTLITDESTSWLLI